MTMILLDIFGQSPIQGPGTGTFTEHLVEIVGMLLLAFAFGFWLARIAVGNWRKKHDSAVSELALLKAESLGLEDKKLEINTLNEKVKLLEDKNGKLRLEASQPVVNSANSVMEAKLQTQDQLIAQLKKDLDDCKKRGVDFSMPSGQVESVVESRNPSQKTKVDIPQVTTKPTAKSDAINTKDNAKLSDKAKPTGKKNSNDDLKKIEGVGPKIESLLNADGIHTYDDVIAAGPDKISSVLLKAGPQYKVHDPTTWGEQSKLAKQEKWDELHKMQAQLKGGKKV